MRSLGVIRPILLGHYPLLMEMIAMLDHQPFFAALDVSLEKTTICVMSLDGTIVKETIVPTDPRAIAACLLDNPGQLERIGPGGRAPVRVAGPRVGRPRHQRRPYGDAP